LAASTVVERNRPSGISGRATRASMARKSANSAAAAPSSASVRGDPQPASLAPTIASTASMSALVTVTAPATSRRAGSRLGAAPGRSARLRAITATPIGRLTRKTQCQS
jgi:hypothetical protein